MLKSLFIAAALCLGRAAGSCSSNAGFDFAKTLQYNAVVTGYNVNVQRIVGNGLGNKIVIGNYCVPVVPSQQAGSSTVSFLLSPAKPTIAPTAKPLAVPSKNPTAMPVVQAVCPAILYEFQKSTTVNTVTTVGYKVNVKRIVRNGLGNKIVLDGYAAKPIITQSAAGMAISSGNLCNAPPPTLKPTAKPVIQVTKKPTAKPVVQSVCPAVSYDLQKSSTVNTVTTTGYKVNVKRIVGNGLGNTIVLEGYAAKPIVTQSAAGIAISSGTLCNAPPPTLKPTATPVVQAVCPAVSYDLQKSSTVNTVTTAGYKVNVKRIVGNGLGNKIVLDGYAAKPIITQSAAGMAISSGTLCNAPPPTLKPTANPVIQVTKKPTAKPVVQQPSKKPTANPVIQVTKKPTAKPVVQQPSKKPTAKPVVESVCPAVSYDLPKAVVKVTVAGYNVNVKRFVGNGIGNKIVVDGYAAKPIITQSPAGIAISSGTLCNAPAPIFMPTVKPVVQVNKPTMKPSTSGTSSSVCPNLPFDLPVHIKLNVTVTGYHVNLKRIIGKGVGNKVVVSNYSMKPIISQSLSGPVISVMLAPGDSCNVTQKAPSMNPVTQKAPTLKPVTQKAPSMKPVTQKAPSTKPITQKAPSIGPVTTPSMKPAPVAKVAPTKRPLIKLTKAPTSSAFVLSKTSSVCLTFILSFLVLALI